MSKNGHTPTFRINIKTVKETAAFYDVTKDMAQDWYENHNPLNRHFRNGLAERYSRDRVNDKWLTTHQAIAFDWNGHMVDGQHRCVMIVRTGLTTRVLVVTGLDPNVRMVTDIGAKRSASDVLQLIQREDANVRNVAVVRQMMNGLGKRASIPEIVDAYDLYAEAANTAINFFPKQNVKNKTIGPVIGVFGRASYTENHDKLEEAAILLTGGKAERGNKGHKSIILLSHFLEGIPSRGEGYNKTIYGYTEAALAAFLANEALDELFVPDEELFALPDKLKKAKLRVVKTLAKTA